MRDDICSAESECDLAAVVACVVRACGASRHIEHKHSYVLSGCSCIGLYGVVGVSWTLERAAGRAECAHEFSLPTATPPPRSTYWLANGGTPKEYYCDMDVQGGGWTRVWAFEDTDCAGHGWRAQGASYHSAAELSALVLTHGCWLAQIRTAKRRVRQWRATAISSTCHIRLALLSDASTCCSGTRQTVSALTG